MILLSKRDLLGFVFSCLLIFLCIGIGLFQQAKEEYHLFDDSPSSSFTIPDHVKVINSTPEECISYMEENRNNMETLAEYMLKEMDGSYLIYNEFDIPIIYNTDTADTMELKDFGDHKLEQMVDLVLQDEEVKYLGRAERNPDEIYCSFGFGNREENHCVLTWKCPRPKYIGATYIDENWSYYTIAAMDE